jgi:alpha-1,6-mannosyltransferase
VTIRLGRPRTAQQLGGAGDAGAASWRVGTALTTLALAMELVLIAGWLRPLALWRHQVNPPAGAQMVLLLGQTRAGALTFAVPALLLIALYIAGLLVAGRAGRRWALVALAAPVLFAATLLPMFPGGTQDIFHNIADGRLFWRYGENPTLVPPAAHPEDRFYPHLFGYTELPSAYGPLWYLLAGPVTALAGDGLVANVLAQKAVMAAFFVATVVLVWWTARALWPSRPGRSTTAAVAVGWCPLLLWELPGNGHNDAVMVFFAAAALAAAVRERWRWVFPLLALSVLVKFTTVLLGPVLLLWSLRRAPGRDLLIGLIAAGLLVVVAYGPFWAGADTFAVLRRPGMTFILSPATLLHGVLAGRLGEPMVSRLSYLTTGVLFALLYLEGLRRVRSGGSGVETGFDAVFAYLALASWWFWPWYLAWLAPLAAWLPGTRRMWAFVLMSGAALLTYLYWWLDPAWRTGAWFVCYALITVGVFALPTALWATAWIRPTRHA